MIQRRDNIKKFFNEMGVSHEARKMLAESFLTVYATLGAECYMGEISFQSGDIVFSNEDFPSLEIYNRTLYLEALVNENKFKCALIDGGFLSISYHLLLYKGQG